MSESKITVGGSAALEGVMMKSPSAWALAVRRPDGTIAVERENQPSLGERFPWTKAPLIRGVAALWDSLSISYRALSRSAVLAGEEDEEISKPALYGTMIFSAVLAIALFIVLPRVLGGFITHNSFIGNLLAGLFKAVLLVGYLLLISRSKDIQRFFKYHGAEHRSIAAFEAGLPLTVKNVQMQSMYHPRCGTSFIAFVIVASIVVYALIPGQQAAGGGVNWLWTVASRVIFLPLVAAVSFEVIRYSAMHRNPVARFLRRVGFQFQKLTVKAPDDDMVEVAIASLKASVGIPDTRPDDVVAAAETLEPRPMPAGALN